MRRAITVATASWLVCALVGADASLAQGPAPTKPVTPQAVWRATGEQLAAIRKECPLKWMQTLVDCFVEAMERQGAPAEAIALAKVLGKDERYLTNLRGAGLVNIADIQRPNLAAAWGAALVNGNPPLIDVYAPDVLQWVGQDAMARGLLAENPELAIRPLMTYSRNFPIAHSVEGGGQEFTAGYTASTGCAWCNAGTVFARLRFDGDGNFLGVSVQNVARDEDTEIPDPDPENGNVRRKVLRHKVGDVIPFKMKWSVNPWHIVTPIDPAVMREADRGALGTFCAGVCFGEEIWFFEAVGKGETHILFRTVPQNGQFSPPEMTVEYVIQVE